MTELNINVTVYVGKAIDDLALKYHLQPSTTPPDGVSLDGASGNIWLPGNHKGIDLVFHLMTTEIVLGSPQQKYLLSFDVPKLAQASDAIGNVSGSGIRACIPVLRAEAKSYDYSLSIRILDAHGELVATVNPDPRIRNGGTQVHEGSAPLHGLLTYGAGVGAGLGAGILIGLGAAASWMVLRGWRG